MDELTKMASHVRYELDKMIDFLALGNGWADVLRPDLQKLTQEMGMNLAGVKKVLDLERRIATLEAEKSQLREELERREQEHSRVVAEVHRSYRRELVLMPRGDLARGGGS